jgi:hypothetical protein
VLTGDPEDVRIYPFFFDAEYCASGWHVLNYNVGDTADFFGSRGALFDYLNSVDITYELDGVMLATKRTAIKRMPASLVDDFYWVGVGTLVAPGTLTVGSHELHTTILDPVFGGREETVRFTVLPC